MAKGKYNDSVLAYRNHECDRFSLSIPSFRQWAYAQGFDHWELKRIPDYMYLRLWEMYARYASKLRRNQSALKVSRRDGT